MHPTKKLHVTGELVLQSECAQELEVVKPGDPSFNGWPELGPIESIPAKGTPFPIVIEVEAERGNEI